MVRKIIPLTAVAAFVASVGARAQDSAVTGDDTSATIASEEQVRPPGLRDEIVALKPQLGALFFKDADNDTTARGAAGIQLDMNLATSLSSDVRNLYIGPQTGFLFSHVGVNTGSNFFGAGDAGAGGNTLVIPANLKAGYALWDRFRISGHGGGNIIYNSIPGQLRIGQSGSFGSDRWSVLPNIGAELEFGLTPRFQLSLRPNYTFAPEDDIATATLLLGFAFG